mmetsp:Transcript_3582/g.5294  ORF Transcript_3582/g.5294 Transcript_3582/m.5294 type:complete len:299 (-) Transcript_3582:3-899(-)
MSASFICSGLTLLGGGSSAPRPHGSQSTVCPAQVQVPPPSPPPCPPAPLKMLCGGRGSEGTLSNRWRKKTFQDSSPPVFVTSSTVSGSHTALLNTSAIMQRSRGVVLRAVRSVRADQCVLVGVPIALWRSCAKTSLGGIWAENGFIMRFKSADCFFTNMCFSHRCMLSIIHLAYSRGINFRRLLDNIPTYLLHKAEQYSESLQISPPIAWTTFSAVTSIPTAFWRMLSTLSEFATMSITDCFSSATLILEESLYFHLRIDCAFGRAGGCAESGSVCCSGFAVFSNASSHSFIVSSYIE